MKIRSATPNDGLAVVQVIIDTFMTLYPDGMSGEALQAYKEGIYESSAARWRGIIEEIAQGNSPRSCLYVAEDDAGQVVGMSYACPSKDESAPQDVGELDMLYIRENFQRQGIGTELVRVTAAQVARAGMKRLHICTPTDHIQGRNFYDKLGGTIIGTRDDVEDGEVIELVVYEWTDLDALVNGDKVA